MTTHRFDPQRVAQDTAAAGGDPLEAVLHALAAHAHTAATEQEATEVAQAATDWIRRPGVPLPYGKHQATVPDGQTLVLVASPQADAEAFAQALADEQSEWDRLSKWEQRRRPRTIVFDGAAIRTVFMMASDRVSRELRLDSDGTWS